MKHRILAVATGLLLAGCSVAVDPLTKDQSRQFGVKRISQATVNQETIRGPVTLYEAMARALKYNLDTKVEIMEAALRVRQLDLAHYSMLPNLVAASGYAGRNEGDPSTASTRDPDVFSSDLTFSWNVLDFGLSYVRAQQAADEVLIQEEMKRKIVNRVIEDVRTAYWRAASYDRLVGRMRGLEGQVAKALRESRELSTSGESSPLVAMTYERELIEITQEVEILEDELMVAKSQLAALMNVTPNSKYTLRPPKRAVAKLELPSRPAELFAIAVTNRPEMRDVAYKLRINDKELDAAMLQLLPNFNLYLGGNYDSNEFIATNDWVSWGAKASWNVMKFASMPATKKKVAAQNDALEARALSVAMAVMTQVHVSRIRYQHLVKRYATASSLSAVTHRILEQVRAEEAAERATEQTRIREEMNTLLSDAKRDMVYADLQNAYANIYASVGLDPFPQGLNTDDSVDGIAKRLEGMWIGRHQKPMSEVAKTN